jgi:hypothetical protein
MTLPVPPRNPVEPIPNGPFTSVDTYYVETTQGRIPLNNSLQIDPEDGSVSLAP